MKKYILPLIILLSIAACKEKKHTIEIVNQSGKKFDSVVVFARGTIRVNFLNLEPGKDAIQSYAVPTDTVVADDVFGSVFYAKDTTVHFGGFAYHNGSAGVPEKIKLVVDSNLKIIPVNQ